MKQKENDYVKIARLEDAHALRKRLLTLNLELPVDTQVLTAEQGSPLAETLSVGPHLVGNRWCIHPMEGWDAKRDGSPTEHTLRRWKNFGRSGAKFIWGGEAAAVCPDGRANPNQTLALPANRTGLVQLLDVLQNAHYQAHGSTHDLLVGLQLTHSGRFCRPREKTQSEPRIAYHHPLLDKKFGIDPKDHSVVLSDDEVKRLIDDYVIAAAVARDAGFHFVDVKACHGYLLHEFLSARTRPGPFGGDLDGRTRIIREIIGRIGAEYPELTVVVRLSVFDMVPYENRDSQGFPMDFPGDAPYEFGFGMDVHAPTRIDLSEPIQLIRKLRELNVAAVNISCGSPYYCPHAQRPAIFPPSDGYAPPEDPLVSVVRQIHAARTCKEAVPEMPMVGSGYTYLQDYLPHVAQAVVRKGWIDSVGLGRMVLSYPEMPADSLSGQPSQRKRICRTFSDCTTAPRNGLVSGCFPLDSYYKSLEESKQLRKIKQRPNRSD